MACGMNAGLPTPLLAAVVDQGPEAVGFYGLALCIGAAGAESKLKLTPCRQTGVVKFWVARASRKAHSSPCSLNAGQRGVLARGCLVQHLCSKLVFGRLNAAAHLALYCLQPDI